MNSYPRIRHRLPDVALTTDIIVGFPGETEEDFEDTLDVVKQAEFDSAFTFIYSDEPELRRHRCLTRYRKDCKPAF